MSEDQGKAGWTAPVRTGAVVLASGAVITGYGVGAVGEAVGEVCFNTAMTGYQEILTDPSYAEQIIAFTFPHIGNVGANPEDRETVTPPARGLILSADVTATGGQFLDARLFALLKDE